ncbi:hypothetical protein EV121DRAFT_296742 [Schizophyllum commune]
MEIQRDRSMFDFSRFFCDTLRPCDIVTRHVPPPVPDTHALKPFILTLNSRGRYRTSCLVNSPPRKNQRPTFRPTFRRSGDGVPCPNTERRKINSGAPHRGLRGMMAEHGLEAWAGPGRGVYPARLYISLQSPSPILPAYLSVGNSSSPFGLALPSNFTTFANLPSLRATCFLLPPSHLVIDPRAPSINIERTLKRAAPCAIDELDLGDGAPRRLLSAPATSSSPSTTVTSRWPCTSATAFKVLASVFDMLKSRSALPNRNPRTAHLLVAPTQPQARDKTYLLNAPRAPLLALDAAAEPPLPITWCLGWHGCAAHCPTPCQTNNPPSFVEGPPKCRRRTPHDFRPERGCVAPLGPSEGVMYACGSRVA